MADYEIPEQYRNITCEGLKLLPTTESSSRKLFSEDFAGAESACKEEYLHTNSVKTS